MFYFILLIFLPFLVLSAVVAAFFYRHTVTELGSTTMDTVAAAAANIHTSLKEREEDSLAVYYSGCVDMLGKDKKLTEGQKASIESAVKGIVYSNQGIKAAYVVSEQGTFHSGGDYSGVLDLMEDHLSDIILAGGKSRWYVTDRLFGKAGSNLYILARSLNSPDEKNVGILYLVVSDKMVTDALGELSRDYSEWYLSQEDGTVLYSSSRQRVGECIDVSMLSMKERSSYQTFREKNGESSIIASYSMMDVHWYCFGIIDLSVLRNRVLELLSRFGLIALIYVGFMALMISFMQKSMFTPLQKMKISMDQYATGNLEPASLMVTGAEEFESLARHYNYMTRRIKNLIEDYKAETEAKNRQRMKTLTAQLTPHFIYNALNTIRWVAVLNKQDQICELTESLVSIFMNAARNDDDTYTLKDELELIRNYAVIQKARFMNFDLQMDIQEGTEELRLPKLLLQPTVENAIVHGMNRGKYRNGIIKILAWIDEDLYIEVSDQGAGFDVEEYYRHPQVKDGHTNIGIANLEEMILLEFGEPYGMKIESEPGKGTTVRYHLPAIHIGEEKK